MAVADEIREQTRKIKDMTFKEKVSYIWYYYKVIIIVAAAVIVAVAFGIQNIRENQKPTCLYAVFINSNFNYDTTNTLEDDYIRVMDVDTSREHLFITFDINLNPDYFDTVALAYQQKLVSLCTSGELDVQIGPVGIMESSADCGNYANLMEFLPADLIAELEDREYEFYTYKGHRYGDDELAMMDEQSRKAIAEMEPYIAGIYLDNCSYLNNMGEYGAYDLTDVQDDRPILTIPANTMRPEAAIGFVRFLLQ